MKLKTLAFVALLACPAAFGAETQILVPAGYEVTDAPSSLAVSAGFFHGEKTATFTGEPGTYLVYLENGTTGYIQSLTLLPHETDVSPILARLNGLEDDIAGLPNETVDLVPLLGRLTTLEAQVATLEAALAAHDESLQSKELTATAPAGPWLATMGLVIIVGILPHLAARIPKDRPKMHPNNIEEPAEVVIGADLN